MIRTHYDPPPIPDRRHDWRAVTADYEPGAPVGYGATEQEAIVDLLDQLEDADEQLAVAGILTRAEGSA